MRSIASVVFLLTFWCVNAQNAVDEMEILKNWSLFTEYHRNGDYRSAVPFGWNVQKIAPARFKTLYHRLGGSYYKLFEQADGELKQAYADTIVFVYDLGVEYVPERAANLYLLKGHALESYHEGQKLEAIEAYTKGMEADFAGAEFFYIDRLGVLYSKNATDENGFKALAIELYRRYLERDPDNKVALDRLKRLIEDPRELIEIALQKLQTDPENPEYIWETARAYVAAEDNCGAVQYIVKLTKKSPDSETYWTELGRTYQRCAVGLRKGSQRRARFRDAIKAYQRAVRINSAVKETTLSIAVCYRELGDFPAARRHAQRAAAKDRSWGLPYIEISQVYEAQVQECVLSVRGGWDKLEFEDKIVYRLAQEYYRRAKSIDPEVSAEAETRARHLDTLVPTQEDYFFNKSMITDGNKIAVTGECYEWIREKITVPSKFQ